MWSKLNKFLSFGFRKQALILESFMYLGWARVMKALPFSKVAWRLGEQMQETSTAVDPSNVAAIKAISHAVRTAARHTPWESKCMVMAMAAMKMLERRNIESTLYLGTARDKEGKMIAHAWLRSGPYYLTGFDEMPLFTTVGKFAKFLPEKTQRSMSNG